MNWIKATRLPISYRNHHLHPPDIDSVDTDDMRKSLSKLKEGFKHRLGGKKRAADSAGAIAAGETVSSSASLARPDSRVTMGGSDKEGSRISADASGVHSRDLSPQPKLVQEDEGCDNPQGRKVDVDEKEVSQTHSRLDPDVEAAAGSGPGREIKRASSPLPVTSIAPKQEPDSTWTLLPQPLRLITPLGNADGLTVPDRVQRDPHPCENAELSTAANKKKLSWKSTALATAKLLLRGVRDSADAFGPLKSVAGGLCFILENCEVWSDPCLHTTILTGYPSE